MVPEPHQYKFTNVLILLYRYRLDFQIYPKIYPHSRLLPPVRGFGRVVREDRGAIRTEIHFSKCGDTGDSGDNGVLMFNFNILTVTRPW